MTLKPFTLTREQHPGLREPQQHFGAMDVPFFPPLRRQTCTQVPGLPTWFLSVLLLKKQQSPYPCHHPQQLDNVEVLVVGRAALVAAANRGKVPGDGAC